MTPLHPGSTTDSEAWDPSLMTPLHPRPTFDIELSPAWNASMPSSSMPCPPGDARYSCTPLPTTTLPAENPPPSPCISQSPAQAGDSSSVGAADSDAPPAAACPSTSPAIINVEAGLPTSGRSPQAPQSWKWLQDGLFRTSRIQLRTDAHDIVEFVKLEGD